MIENLHEWHYRYVCKLCLYHERTNIKPTVYDFQVKTCNNCDQTYGKDWGFGIYRLVNRSKWYNPFSWNKTEWLNKLIEEDKYGKETEEAFNY